MAAGICLNDNSSPDEETLVLGLANNQRVFGQAKFWPAPRSQNSNIPSLITNLAQLRGLDESATSFKIPVRIRGGVTYCEDQWPTLFVQDGENPSHVFRPKGTIPLGAGDLVEVEGIRVVQSCRHEELVGDNLQTLRMRPRRLPGDLQRRDLNQSSAHRRRGYLRAGNSAIFATNNY